MTTELKVGRWTCDCLWARTEHYP